MMRREIASHPSTRPPTSVREDERSDCRLSAAEDQIARDVYGCDAGRNCIQATLEQRICFETQIAERMAELPVHNPEGT